MLVFNCYIEGSGVGFYSENVCVFSFLVVRL